LRVAIPVHTVVLTQGIQHCVVDATPRIPVAEILDANSLTGQGPAVLDQEGVLRDIKKG